MLLKLTLLAILCSSCIIKKPTAQDKFITFPHFGIIFQDEYLIKKIAAPHWTIGYRFATVCPEHFRENKLPRLQTIISDVLRAWLQPLQKLHAGALVDEFRYVQLKDYAGGEDDDNAAELAAIDLPITFRCENGFSFIESWGKKISVHIRRGTSISSKFIHAILHEIGHAFGLADTYAKGGRMENRGGWDGTAGTQPTAVMAGHGKHNVIKDPPRYLLEDDVRAIQWLYKHIYQGLPVDDCFFPDYVLEPEPGGCRPKYPLIFAVKHPGALPAHLSPLGILDDDPKLDINTRDDGGYTALHYAVIQGNAELVQQMLTHPDIKTDLSNNDGQTPLDLARAANLTAIIKMLTPPPEPEPRSVKAHGKKIQTWGAMKKGR